MARKWTLDDALKLIRGIQPSVKGFGFHVALAGGVLNLGESDKDLDLVILPLDNKAHPENVTGLVTWLTGLWGDGEAIGAAYAEPDELSTPIYGFHEGSPYVKVPYKGGDHVFDWEVYRADTYHRANTAPPRQIYRYKLKFMRSGDDRIDVFII